MGLSHTSIRVKNMNRSVAFYTKAMGLKVVERIHRFPGEKITSLIDRGTKQRLNLMWYAKSFRWYTPYKMNGVELDHLMFEVKDAKAAFKRLVKMGAPVAMKLFEGKEISMAMVKDPNGIWIGLRSRNKKR